MIICTYLINYVEIFDNSFNENRLKYLYRWPKRVNLKSNLSELLNDLKNGIKRRKD